MFAAMFSEGSSLLHDATDMTIAEAIIVLYNLIIICIWKLIQKLKNKSGYDDVIFPVNETVKLRFFSEPCN